MPPQTINVQPFEEISVPFAHQWTEETHPFTGAAVIDIDADGKFEIFVGGGDLQQDALLQYQNGKILNMIESTGLSSNVASYGATAIDLDNNGTTDLLVARNDGVYLYLNEQGKFQGQRLPIQFEEDSVPLSVSVSDIDHDGDGDLYISVFVSFSAFRSAVFNDPSHAKPNKLLLNNGDLTFTDITESSGTASKQNTFFSSFVDLNGDGWQDLVVAQNTGEIEIFQNNQDLTFSLIPYHSGYGFWMGLAIGDMDNDGDQDLFFSNLGNSIPDFLTTGDLRDDQRHEPEWLLLRNDGDFQFTNVTDFYQLTGYGFAWGAVFEDLNYDGYLDLLVAQNYIKWPLHKLSQLPNKSYLQVPSAQGSAFFHVKQWGLENPHYGQSPVIVDLNGDGSQDVVWVNMNGPVRVLLNTADNNFITLSFPDTVASLGTTVKVITNDGVSYTKEIIANSGLLTDQTPELVFGLGQSAVVKSIEISWPDGTQQFMHDLPSQTKYKVQKPAK